LTGLGLVVLEGRVDQIVVLGRGVEHGCERIPLPARDVSTGKRPPRRACGSVA
jgi:hypothetical protein